APAVSRVVRDIPLPEYEDQLPLTPRDPARFVALSQRWGLDSALERFLQALEAARLATDE
ncbi:MAG: putative 5-3 exonuclease, partial [Frankiales bacterium]|nr:putative 5-3 exonuclease [Frankiales bacterium]